MKKIFLMFIPLIAALPVLNAVSCSDEKLARLGPRTEVCLSEIIPVQEPVAVDILVVVDNSSSMAQEQAMLAEAFPSLLKSLLDPPLIPETRERIHAPVRDLHLGVISTDMGVGGYDVPTCEENPLGGDDGVLLHATDRQGCASVYPEYLYYDIGFSHEPDLEQVDRLAADFGCIAMLGTGGCGFEQQLEAAHKALFENAAPGGPNAGFLRSGSILTILFLTDEDDCSAADLTIFDNLPPKANLQCYWNKPKLHPLERYIDDFKALQGGTPGGETPWNLVLGFIVGVPPDEPLCNGHGDELAGCLDLQEMQEVVEGNFLAPACTYPRGCRSGVNCDVEAYPARRFVELAKMFGENAVVQSICGDDFSPALDALTGRLMEALDKVGYHRSFPVAKDARDPSGCRCVVSCTMVEELSDDRPCSGLLLPLDSDRDTIPDTTTDEEGGRHTLCEVPQAGSVLDDCTLGCGNPEARHAKDSSREGWWYDPNADPDGDGVTEPLILFGEFRVQKGSSISIHCCSEVCGADRSCGSLFDAYDRTSKCCNEEEYCYHPGGDMTREGLCLLRRDICEGYGTDLWCPGAGLPGNDPLIGGLCCLDPEGDGHLDMTDADGDGLLDTSLYRCDAGTCVPR